MKTQEQKLQHVMEAAGECWHDVTDFAGEVMGHYYLQCTKCKISNKLDGKFVTNPSPDDLNELFRLAGKQSNVDITSINFFIAEIGGKDTECCELECSTFIFKGDGDTPAEALLNSLFIATGGKE